MFNIVTAIRICEGEKRFEGMLYYMCVVVVVVVVALHWEHTYVQYMLQSHLHKSTFFIV